MVIMWFSLHPHFLLYNFAEIMYFIITKKKKQLRAARADHGPRATDGKGQEKAAALAVSMEDGKFLLGHTPQSWQLLPLQGKEGRKGMTLLSVQSVVHPPHRLPRVSALCWPPSRLLPAESVCVWNFPDWCVSFTQSKSLNDFAFNTLPFQFKWGEKTKLCKKTYPK